MKEKREYTIYHYSAQLFLVVYMLVFISLISISVNNFYLIFVTALIAIVFFADEFFVAGKYYKMSFEKNSIKLSTWYNLLPFFKKELLIRFDDIESWYFKKNTGQKGLYHKWIIRLKNGKSIVFKTYYLSSKRPSKDFNLAFYRFVQLVKHYNEMNTKQQIECLELKIINPRIVTQVLLSLKIIALGVGVFGAGYRALGWSFLIIFIIFHYIFNKDLMEKTARFES